MAAVSFPLLFDALTHGPHNPGITAHALAPCTPDSLAYWLGLSAQAMWRRTYSSNMGTVKAITSWRGE